MKFIFTIILCCSAAFLLDQYVKGAYADILPIWFPLAGALVNIFSILEILKDEN